MSLAASLRSAVAQHSGRRCQTCVLMDVLAEKDRVALAAAFDDEALSTSAIWRAVEAEGHDVSAHSLRRHRSGGCSGA